MTRRLDAYPMWLSYSGLWGFVAALSWVTTPVYLIRDVGMSPLELVLAGTALEVAYSLFEVPTGIVADLYSRRLSLVVAGVVMGAGMLVVGLVPAVWAVLVGMAVWGAGWTFRSGAEDAWLADETDRDTMNRAYNRGAQVGRVGRLLGLVAAIPLALVDLRLPLLVAGAVSVGIAVLVAVAMAEHGFTRPERTGSHVAQGLRTARDGVRVVRGTPALVLVLGIFLVLGAWQEGFDRLWEAHLLLDVGVPDLLGLDSVTWFSVLAIAVTLLSFGVAAPLVARWERLSQARLARLLLVMHLLLDAVRAGVRGDRDVVAGRRGVPRHGRRTRPHGAAVPRLAERQHHRLVAARDRAVGDLHRRQCRGVGRRPGPRPGRQPVRRPGRPHPGGGAAAADARAVRAGGAAPRRRARAGRARRRLRRPVWGSRAGQTGPRAA